MRPAIIDTGIGNFGSIAGALRRVGATPYVASTPEALDQCTHIVLPGVGNFDAAVHNLDERGLRPALSRRVLHDGMPLLGICLGMQILGKSSEEGRMTGLGWLPGRTVRLHPASNGDFRVPHIGWDDIMVRQHSSLLCGLAEGTRFYYVHSYHYVDDANDDIVAVTNYGGMIAAILRRGNIVGTQFHPERSGGSGLQLLRNFLGMKAGD
jgi:imidazole glycerol-phosphate synthase subunit HisH